MQNNPDLRQDASTAGHVAHALTIQSQFGFEHAFHYLKEAGIDSELARRLLAIRFDRRQGR